MSNRRGDTTANVVGAVVLVGVGVLIGVVVRSGGGGGGKDCPGWLNTTPDKVMYVAQYSNNELISDVSGFLYDDRGENSHTLIPGGTAKASIQRLAKSGNRKASCFDDHPSVIAVIHSDAAYGALHLTPDPNGNYFVVWRDKKEPDATKGWHGAILSVNERWQIPNFEYLAHWRKVDKPDNPDDEVKPPSEVDPKIENCWSETNPTRRACFVDLPKSSSTAAVGTGLGLRMFALREDNSVPWVACAQAGCCCGGTGCHDEK